MTYLVLLASILFFSMGIWLAQLKPTAKGRSLTYLLWGFMGMAVGLLYELALSFNFNETLLKGYYLFRVIAPPIWIGLGFFLASLNPVKNHKLTDVALALCTLIALALVGTTQITDAWTWFNSQIPLEAQYPYILATNRPTRFFVAASNIWFLTAASIYSFAQHDQDSGKSKKVFLVSGILIATGAGLFSFLSLFPLSPLNVHSNLITFSGTSALIWGLSIRLINRQFAIHSSLQSWLESFIYKTRARLRATANE